MNNIKVVELLKHLNDNYEQLVSELNFFKDDVLKWSDELLEALENEHLAANENTFQLPKTPIEKLRETRRKKGMNSFLSNCSMISTADECEISNLNESVSTRTRAARRGCTSKMMSLNVAKEKKETIKVENSRQTKVIESFVKEQIAEATFVVPQSTICRTKPVAKDNLPSNTVPVESLNSVPHNSRVTRSRSVSSSKSGVRKRSKTPNETPSEVENKRNSPPSEILTERLTRSKLSRTLSGSPVGRLSRGKEPSKEEVISSPVERPSRKKASRAISASPPERQSRRKKSRITGPTDEPIENNLLRSSSQNAMVECDASTTQDIFSDTFKKIEDNCVADKTLTIKKEATPKIATTFIVSRELDSDGCVSGEEKTPRVKSGKFLRLSKTSTPVVRKFEASPKISLNMSSQNAADDVVTSAEPVNMVVDSKSPVVEDKKDKPNPKNKKKIKKEEEISKENIEDTGETVRITRTKSKAIKQMLEDSETKQTDLSTTCAKKILNKAKMTSLKKNQLTALLENNQLTPKSNSEGSKVPVGTLKSKYHLLLSNSKPMKTPLATLPNNSLKIPKSSADKYKAMTANRDKSVETLTRTASKAAKEDILKTKKAKEEEAAIKRQNVIKKKQEELKKKNELKHQLAMKQREKLEQEKYNTMIQSEKEKEEKHKLILQERQIKLKEEVLKKKILTQQKIAETNERRRLEEEARIAKLKEQEAEEQRLALEKQREQERQEKRAQERLAQKKAREEYEMQLRQEMEAERIKAEKMSAAKKHLQSASKMQSASKRPKFMLLTEKKEWDYKARNENDYGLEDEHSEYESDEGYEKKTRPPVPWAEGLLSGKCIALRDITFEMMSEFIPCYQKSPDIQKMFNMTPTRQIRRNSSAIWSTPSS